MKELNAIHSSSGSDVRSENTLTGENLEVKVSSCADIRYSGNPGVKDINESSGGDVQRR